MILKKGDKVTIKSKSEIEKLPLFDDETHQSKEGIHFSNKMFEYCGQVKTIRSVNYFSNESIYYELEGNIYSWSSDFFKRCATCDFCKGYELNFNGLRLHKSDNNLIIDGQEVEIMFCPFCGFKI